MIKVEKLPAAAENWMGISEFCDPIEYVFFCLVLMFLEDKEAEDQFVLSELTEYVQSQYREEQIDWTIYRYRRQDEIGTPLCITVDFQTVGDDKVEADNCVTVRDRDTMEQIRMPISELKEYIAKKVAF